MTDEHQITEILKAYRDKTISASELQLLQEWVEQSPANREVVALLDESAELLPLLGHLYTYDQARVWNNIRSAAQRRTMRERVRHFGRYAAALLLVLLLGSSGWWAYRRHSAKFTEDYIEQLTPGIRGAMLTLSSGEQIPLGANDSRGLIEQDGTRIEIQGNEITYRNEFSKQPIPIINTITVPRNKEFSLCLSDGTQVWLNSESTLIYPVHFGTESREVQVIGEAYFEVAHDATRRFTVHTDTVSVQVYGTAFNLSAYADDAAIETTLISGSVEVQSRQQQIRLEPGEQARIGRSQPTVEVRQVAAEDAAAWTRGLFAFNDESVASICRKLSRWYDIEIIPTGVDAEQVRYTGVVKRYETFGEMLRLLERTKQIRPEVLNGQVLLHINRENG